MPENASLSQVEMQERLVHALAQPGALGLAGQSAEILETHISWVLLAGEHAWKIKKPLNLGFLDFSTLALRRHFCEEELRLNRRLAPELYLDVVAIHGTPEAPQIGALDMPAIEYAVLMRRFPQSALADRMLAVGTLLPGHIDELARCIAQFHAGIPRAVPPQAWGLPDHVMAPVLQNFAQLRGLGETGLTELENWTRDVGNGLPLAERQARGYVRECHGDLHLGNIAVVDGRVRVFDGIEFNPELRWIDIQSEVAFLVMDLLARGRPAFAARFLNAWLESSGDYAGLVLQPWYQVYRAMVRAKVARIRAAQPHLGVEVLAAASADYRAHLELAAALAQARPRALLLTHGYAGSGKSSVSLCLLEALGAVRLRSDVERKRLAGLAAEDASHSDLDAGLYSLAQGQATYAESLRLARQVAAAGYPVIVDACFLQRRQRDEFRALAAELNLPFLILACHANTAELRRRVTLRASLGQDASEATPAVLEHQFTTAEALAEDEMPCVLAVDTQRAGGAEIACRVRARLGWGPNRHGFGIHP